MVHMFEMGAENETPFVYEILYLFFYDQTGSYDWVRHWGHLPQHIMSRSSPLKILFGTTKRSRRRRRTFNPGGTAEQTCVGYNAPTPTRSNVRRLPHGTGTKCHLGIRERRCAKA